MNKILLLSLLIFLTVFVCNAVNFNAPRSVSLPSYQVASASGDLNNDGFPDLITGGHPRQDSEGVGRIYVMLGKGNGSLKSPQEYLVGYNQNEIYWGQFVQQIKIADLNNDNNLDVVVIHNFQLSIISESTLYVTVLFGNGDGTLQNAEAYSFIQDSITNFVSSLALVDMDNDGLKDIVLSVIIGTNISKIHVLRNAGNGNFTNVARILIPSNVYSIDVTDLNNDIHPDYILATSDGIIIGYNNGGFFPVKYEQKGLGVFESGLLVEDLNSDGRIDIATVPRLYAQIRIFFNTTDGFPETPVVYNTLFTSTFLKSGDINGDGKRDLIINNNVDYGIQILYNTGNGTFNNSQSFSDFIATELVTADFNLDGKIDLGAASGGEIFLNSPNNTRYYTDFNGDRKSDFTVYRPSAGTWWTFFNGGNNYAPYRAIQFGLPTDKIVPANYDDDNKADIALYRDGVWYILQSSDNSVRIEQWGTSEDIPVPADFDNDGASNLAVFRPSSGTWYIKTGESFYAVNWGISTDKPTQADYDGDGKIDIAVYRPSNGVWYILNSKSGEVTIKNFGLAEDKPVAADYDGDGKSDVAVFRPSNGVWYIEQSSDNSIRYQQFGLSADTPVINDFDGDSKNDISVFRQSEGTWYILQSSNSTIVSTVWGNNKDIPVNVLNNF